MPFNKLEPIYKSFNSKESLLSYRDHCKSFFASKMGYTKKENDFNEVFAEFIQAKDFNTAIAYATRFETKLPVNNGASILMGFNEMLSKATSTSEMYIYEFEAGVELQSVKVYASGEAKEDAVKTLNHFTNMYSHDVVDSAVRVMAPSKDLIGDGCDIEYRAYLIIKALEGFGTITGAEVGHHDREHLDIFFYHKLCDLGGEDFRDIELHMSHSKLNGTFSLTAHLNDGAGTYDETPLKNFDKDGYLLTSNDDFRRKNFTRDDMDMCGATTKAEEINKVVTTILRKNL
ncbi:hypothetical protein VCHA53O466_50114 [Vibrio chagasii]|nr:hypothetical protein VCHA53O466_50114 [Vibrio chagasii]